MTIDETKNNEKEIEKLNERKRNDNLQNQRTKGQNNIQTQFKRLNCL